MEAMNDLTFSGLLHMAMNMLYMKKHYFFFAYFCLPMSIQILEYTFSSNVHFELVIGPTSLSDDSDSAP